MGRAADFHSLPRHTPPTGVRPGGTTAPPCSRKYSSFAACAALLDPRDLARPHADPIARLGTPAQTLADPAACQVLAVPAFSKMDDSVRVRISSERKLSGRLQAARAVVHLQRSRGPAAWS